jgi:hypothetical protein
MVLLPTSPPSNPSFDNVRTSALGEKEFTSPESSLNNRKIDAKRQTIGIHYILKASNTNSLPTVALVPSCNCNNPPPAIHANGPY